MSKNIYPDIKTNIIFNDLEECFGNDSNALNALNNIKSNLKKEDLDNLGVKKFIFDYIIDKFNFSIENLSKILVKTYIFEDLDRKIIENEKCFDSKEYTSLKKKWKDEINILYEEENIMDWHHSYRKYFKNQKQKFSEQLESLKNNEKYLII